MMPVEWPPAAPAADRQVDPVRLRARRDRLVIVQADFFLDEGGRLTDEERSLMSAMLRGLVLEIADELIAGLPALVGARAEGARDGAYRRLREIGLLERAGLVDLLLRRADEQQLIARNDRGADAMVGALVGDEDPAIAEAAMALTIARGRRRDRFGRLGIEFDDLSAEDAVAVVHAVSAILRDRLDRDADPLLATAAQRLLAQHDEGRRLEASVAMLARALDQAGRSDDDLLKRLAQEGDAALLVAILARRAGIDGSDGWNFFTGGDAMLLARMAGCERATAAQILAAFDVLVGLGAPDRAIDQFDAIDEERAERCRRWMRLDPHYRAARDLMDRTSG
jgi:hypothetical protein